MVTKKFFIIALLCALGSAIVMAQDANQAAPELTAKQKAAIFKEFSRSATLDDITFNFVLLNNKTIDVLFSGDGRYAMRARANSSTTFYIQGVPQRFLNFNPQFTVEQDGKAIPGEIINIRNFQASGIDRKTRVEGLLQLSQKIDLTQPFKIKGAHGTLADFKLSREALKLLEN